jgi:hypothetical protein
MRPPGYARWNTTAKFIEYRAHSFTAHLSDPEWRADPPWGPGGPLSMFFCVNGGCSRISGTASQGGPLSTFSTSMVDAPGSPLSPPRGPAVDVFCVNGGRSLISVIASHRPRCRRFLRQWWVLPNLRHRLPGGPSMTFFALNGRRSQISIIAPREAAVDIFALNGGRSRSSRGPCSVLPCN